MQEAVVHLSVAGVRITRSPDLPLEALLLGRPVAEAAALLPRLFNLCRMAQGTAARMALGLPVVEDTIAEVLRDHAVKIFVTLRRVFGMTPLPLPALTANTLFGPPGVLPTSPGDLADWMQAELPTAELARQIAARFRRGQAIIRALPPPPDPLAEGAFENSPAARQADHPVLRAVEARDGRGPMWRYLGLLADAETALAGHLPAPRMQGDTAVVQAARGAYALRITRSGGLVTGLVRRTPTDHILAPGGALEQALTGVDPALAPLVVALHDPCVPVTVREATHA
jgi:hypothetical protein